MHIAGKAANEGFIDFNFPAQLPAVIILQGKPDAMHHEPCCFLSDSKIASNFITANSILAITQHPHSGKPFIKADGGILENGSNLDGELPLSMMAGALPHATGWIELYPLRPASGADHAFGPALCHEIIKAIVWAREVDYRFLKGFWFAHDFVPHKQNHSKFQWMSQVNYCPK
jgi:hypothetical protein